MDGVALGGDPACWHSIYNFDFCCDARHGPTGNTLCWDGRYTYRSCCLPPETEATCWDEARSFVDSSGEGVAGHPALQDDGNLAAFCCYPTAFSSQVCWGAGRPGGAALVRDSESRTPLNFTRRYVECCLRDLRRRVVAEDAPAWMDRQMDLDLKPWESSGPFAVEDLDAFEAAIEASGHGEHFCRFRVRDGEVFHCDFKRSGYTALLNALRAALHVLLLVVGLPDLDFFVRTNEHNCVNDVNVAFAGDKLPVPVLVQAQPAKCKGVLMPWWAYMTLDWAKLYSDRIHRASAKWPWEERTAKLFWRGSDTGCLLPDSCESGVCSCTNWTSSNWPRFPRSKLTLTSTVVPARVDALFTKNVVHHDCAENFDAAGLWVDDLVPPEKHVHYKYLMYIDGLSFSDRLYWLMLTNSLIFRSDSQLRVWIDSGLQPWEHYVPVAENLTDLVDRLDWARANDKESAAIATAGTNFARRDLSLEGSIYYFYRLLLRLADLVKVAASGGGASRGSSDSRDEVARERGENDREAEDAMYLRSLQEMRARLMAAGVSLKTSSTDGKAGAGGSGGGGFANSVGDTEGSDAEADAGVLECWALGYSASSCCNADFFGAGGNPACWDGAYTFQTCCTGRLAEREYWAALDAQQRAADVDR